MRLDIVLIKAEIARLQKLLEIADDPQMLDLIDRLTVMNTQQESTEQQGQLPLSNKQRDQEIPPEVAPQREDPPQRMKKGALKQAVREAVSTETDWFDGYALTERMGANGFRFASSKPSISVIDVLRGFALTGLLDVKQGTGNGPNLYKRIEGKL